MASGKSDSPSRRRALLAGIGAGAALLAYSGYEVLSRKNERDARKRLQDERRALVKAIPKLETSGLIARIGLARFLAYWNGNVLTRLRSARFPLDKVQAQILTAGSIFRPAASPEDIRELEARLALHLPPSLSAFLQQANGVSAVIDYGSESLEFFPTRQIAWLQDLDRQLVQIWTQQPIHVTDAEYNRYGAEQDVIKIRSEYLKRIVAIGPVVDSGVFLINPNVVFSDGEMEAWDFSVKYPGAKRYRSLHGLLEEHVRDQCWNLDYWSISHGWKT